MLSYDQRHTGKKTQSHIQLPSQRMSHFPPSLTTTLLQWQEMEHIDQNKAKRSGFEDVTGSLSSQKLLDKERERAGDRGEGDV